MTGKGVRGKCWLFRLADGQLPLSPTFCVSLATVPLPSQVRIPQLDVELPAKGCSPQTFNPASRSILFRAIFVVQPNLSGPDSFAASRTTLIFVALCLALIIVPFSAGPCFEQYLDTTRRGRQDR